MTAEIPDKPKNRKEQYLAKIAGQTTPLPPDGPRNRIEMYLNAIAENGGGGGGGGGEGGIKTLTAADLNYDPDGSGTNTAIAAWLLDSGVYYFSNAEQTFSLYMNTEDQFNGGDPCFVAVLRPEDSVIMDRPEGWIYVITYGILQAYYTSFETGEKTGFVQFATTEEIDVIARNVTSLNLSGTIGNFPSSYNDPGTSYSVEDFEYETVANAIGQSKRLFFTNESAGTFNSFEIENYNIYTINDEPDHIELSNSVAKWDLRWNNGSPTIVATLK